MLRLLLVVLLTFGGIESQSIPEEIKDMSVTIQRGMLGVEALLVEGFTGIKEKMDKLQDVIEADTIKIEQIWNMTKDAMVSTDVQIPATRQTCNATASDFDTRRCGDDNLLLTSGDRFVVIVDDGDWTTDRFCSVLSNQHMEWHAYSIDVDLYNHRGGANIRVGHLGIMYNAVDHENFDFVYIRPHSRRYCYQTGAMVDGALDWSTTGKTSHCPRCIRRRTWFNLKVVVKGDVAALYLNGDLMKGDQKMMHPHRAKGGVIVANGYENIVHFKNFRISRVGV